MVDNSEFLSAAVEAGKRSISLFEEQQKVMTLTQYGVFNDAEVWDPLFAAGEMPEALREILVERPLYQSELLQEAVRHARFINEERGLRGEIDKIGYVVVQSRQVVEHPWKQVPWEEVEQSLFR